MLFWTVAGAVTVPLVAVTPFLPAAFLVHTTAVRLLCAVVAGLLVASFAAGSAEQLARRASG
jgi:hypothetical protein